MILESSSVLCADYSINNVTYTCTVANRIESDSTTITVVVSG